MSPRPRPSLPVQFAHANAHTSAPICSALSFFSEEHSQGISIPYSHISIHAKSKAVPPHKPGQELQSCLYCQIEETALDDLDDRDSPAESHEVYIWPSDPSKGELLCL